MRMRDKGPDTRDDEFWSAHAPGKEAWKAAGNIYTESELTRMSEDFADLVIKRPQRRVYVID